MAVHDAYPRLTPYELLLPDAEFADRRFPTIAGEAAGRGVDADNPAAFVMLGAVQGVLAELREEEAPSEAAHDHGGALHFAYQMWRGGGCGGPPEPGVQPALVLAARQTVRDLLDEAAGAGTEAAGRAGQRAESATMAGRAGAESARLAGQGEEASAKMAGRGGEDCQIGRSDAPGLPEWQTSGFPGSLEGRAGYLQLPQHLAWLAAETPPESVDGFFWHADARGTLHLALAAGVRTDRAGYLFVPVPPQPLAALPEWVRGPAREGGGDFTTELPGAELDALVGIQTPAEVYKLAGLLLRRMEAASGSDVRPPPQAESEATHEGGPRPTALHWKPL